MSVDTLFVKMHTGDPGVSGTANAAVNTTRKQLSVADEANPAGKLVQDAVVAYTGPEVTATESYAWVSFWDAVTGGNHLGNEDIANQAATVAVALNIAVGVITVTPVKAKKHALQTELLGFRAGLSPDGNRGPNGLRKLQTWAGQARAVLAQEQQAKFARFAPQTI
jgi:hypothetical protein